MDVCEIKDFSQSFVDLFADDAGTVPCVPLFEEVSSCDSASPNLLNFSRSFHSCLPIKRTPMTNHHFLIYLLLL